MENLYNALRNNFENGGAFDQKLHDCCTRYIDNPSEMKNKSLLGKLISTSAILKIINDDLKQVKPEKERAIKRRELYKFRKRILNEIGLNLDQKEMFRKDILFVSANPREFYYKYGEDTADLLEDKEFMHIKELEDNEWAIVTPCFNCTYEQLRNELQIGGYEIIHFSSHGNGDGIVLRKNKEEIDLITVDEIMRLLKVFNDVNNLEFVFLNSCKSENLAKELKKKFENIKFAYYVKDVESHIALQLAKDYYQSFQNELGAQRLEDLYLNARKNLIDRNNMEQYPDFKII